MNRLIARLRAGFTPIFWVANVLELFERFAFYGCKAVLVVYIANKVGLSEDAGKLNGMFGLAIFGLPIFAGVFVDRYGFKRTLMACFAIFCVGYFLIGMAGLEFGQSIVDVVGKKPYMIAVLLLTAVGGSLIKPCIVGTVAKTSKPDAKSLGFSIYYTLVNIGGAVGPILALQVREGLGIEYVLVMSSFTSLLLFLGAMFFYKEPVEEGERSTKSFGKVFIDMLLVFGNLRFISFLIIFSGFWIMFWQIFYSFPFYVTDVLKFPQFELLETVDAWTIIFVSVPITALVKRWSAITAMTVGFAIASACWFIIGAVPTVTAAIIGVALFAIGEATQSPRFYDYVSGLAPKEQVGTFMGFAFLPVALGAQIAGILADWLRASYLHPILDASGKATGQIHYDPIMWYIVGGVGVAATVLMLLYNIIFSPKVQTS
ncbi:MAG: MFS transporter [Bacteroidetes bacterium]|nr:MAG: MFS transporter [Bacteroidota bacterium]